MRAIAFLFLNPIFVQNLAHAESACSTIALDDRDQSVHPFPIWNLELSAP